MNERYVDEHNQVYNRFIFSIRVPDQTEEYILELEDHNYFIIDEVRQIGTYMECNKCK